MIDKSASMKWLTGSSEMTPGARRHVKRQHGKRSRQAGKKACRE